jgi:hypothetical protein
LLCYQICHLILIWWVGFLFGLILKIHLFILKVLFFLPRFLLVFSTFQFLLLPSFIR